MSFDKATRNALARMVGQVRDRLTSDVMDQLLRLGFQAGGTVLDLDRIAGLSASEREAGHELREQLEHFIALESGNEAARRRGAYERLAREIGFTTFNRLVALRMAEERGLIVQAVGEGLASAGFQLYERVARGALGNRAQTYRAYVECLYDELALDLPALFDRTTPESRIFPSERALEDVLARLNDPALAHLWREDEAIGWVYQYYNDPAERKKLRDASQAPRNSRELVVRNQFFTPRYVVEFLTDNTLGRIWYEMRRGETALADNCRYLVRRRHPIWLAPDEPAPEPFDPHKHERASEGAGARDMWIRPNPEIHEWMPGMVEYALTVDGYAYAQQHFASANTGEQDGFNTAAELANNRLKEYRETGHWRGRFEELRVCLFFEQRRWRHSDERTPEGDDWAGLQALYRAICEAWDREADSIVYRPKKDPRDLKILDPACGSGHFLLYSFDLLATIYEEAWEDVDCPAFEATGKRLRDDYADLDTLRRAVPGLILRHNLHGVDIDPRACQIAGLSLWLRAQRAYQQLGLKAAERPPITKGHIVCAESMPGEHELLQEFITRLQPRVLGQLVEVIFDRMRLAGEAGSLLQIESEIGGAIAEAKKQWQQVPKAEQAALWPDEKEPPPSQLALFDVSGITDESFWSRAETLVLAALRDYASQAEDGQATQRRLFAEDAVQGFAFIDLCRQRFDVVLMNPPFGIPSTGSKVYVDRSYIESKEDMDAAFISRGMHWISKGFLGAIVNRTQFFKPGLRRWRQGELLGASNIDVAADLGFGVLDAALVEAAVYVSRLPADYERVGQFFRLLKDRDKELPLLNRIARCRSPQGEVEEVFLVRPEIFGDVPESRISYWASDAIRASFTRFPALEGYWGTARQGSVTSDNFRFLRLCWEVPSAGIARGKQETFQREKTWVVFAKGGEYSPYFQDLHLVVAWHNDGLELRSLIGPGGRLMSRPQNLEYNFRTALTYSERTASGFSPRLCPAGCVYSHMGPHIALADAALTLPMLGILMSRVSATFIELMVESGDAVTSGSTARHYT